MRDWLKTELEISALALGALGLGVDAWATPGDLELGGGLRIRAESFQNRETGEERGQWLLRTRTDTRFFLSEESSVFFQPQFSKAFGELGPAGQVTSGGTSMIPLGVHQAYFDYGWSDTLGFLLGRQELSYGDERVMGALGWSHVGRSFDALRARWQGENHFLDLFASKLIEGGAVELQNRDRDLLGLYGQLGREGALRELDFYLLHIIDRREERPYSRLWTLGARGRSALGPLGFMAELTAQNQSLDFQERVEYQADVELGVDLGDVLPIRLSGGYFRASRDYDQLFPTAHKFLGIADVFGRRNIQGAKVGLHAFPGERFNAVVDVHRFYRSYSDSPAFALNGQTAIAGSEEMGRKSLGTELDLVLRYALEENVNLESGTGLLFPEAGLGGEKSGLLPKFYYLQMNVLF